MLRSIPRFIAFLLAFIFSIATVSLSQIELYSIQDVQVGAPPHLEMPLPEKPTMPKNMIICSGLGLKEKKSK